ncbi:MAG: protein kinase [Phycisphaerales bacterium]|nr:protein kinase [Phycisphaerales bacterium]
MTVLDVRPDEMSMNKTAYNGYRDLHRYGSMPHAGFGLGFERTVSYAADSSHEQRPGCDSLPAYAPQRRFLTSSRPLAIRTMNTTDSQNTPAKSNSRRANTLPSDYMLDEYRIHSVLGAGGFGVTYKALDTHLENWVAIKEYFPVEWSFRDGDGVTVHANTQGHGKQNGDQISDYLWGLERFLDEARVLARIQHPHVVRVRRYFRIHGTAYIVMDYEEGIPLSALLQDGETLTEEEIRSLLEDVLLALQAVHEQGYLHRDIKPANLYLRASDQRVILIDFGAARAAVGRQSKSVTSLVTPGYSPPEQYTTRNERYGTWTDIYALAAVLYRCITGRIPVEAVGRLLDDSLQPAIVEGAGRYSTNLLRVIDRALAVRPEQRFRTVADMQAALADREPTDNNETLILPPLPPVRFDKAESILESAASVEGASVSSPLKESPSGKKGLEATTKPAAVNVQLPGALKSRSVHSTVPDMLHWRSLGIRIGGSLAVALAAALAVTVAVWLWPSISVTPTLEEPAASPPRYSLDQSGRAIMTAPPKVASPPEAPVPNETTTANSPPAAVPQAAPAMENPPSEASPSVPGQADAGTEAPVEPTSATPGVVPGMDVVPLPASATRSDVVPGASDSPPTSTGRSASSTTKSQRSTRRQSKSQATRREASQKQEDLKPIVITPAPTRRRPSNPLRTPVSRNPWETPTPTGFNQK